jgi:hypothetical protein
MEYFQDERVSVDEFNVCWISSFRRASLCLI